MTAPASLDRPAAVREGVRDAATGIDDAVADRPASAGVARDATADATTAGAEAAAAAASGTRRGRPRRVLGLLGRVLVNAGVAAAVVAFLGLAVGPHVFDYRTMTMLTGSMAPDIEPGDITVVTPLPVEDVRPGMVITYHIPLDDHRVVTHRVVDVERTDDGKVAVHTKGDANADVDPWTATLEGDTAYQVQAVVPGVGAVLRLLRTPGVQDLLVIGVPAVLVGWVLLSVWRPREQS